jgi:hypothetical protein
MDPLTASIAPSTLTDAVVSKPAKTKVMPNARTIGHAVGAGSLTLSAGVSTPGSAGSIKAML